MLCLWILPVSLPGYEFKGSFDQLIDCSVVFFFWILLPFFVFVFVLFPPTPKLVNPRAGALEVREVVVQGGDV